MEEGKRQKQVAAVLQDELNNIFRKLGLNMMGGGMVSIAQVKVTPDLLEARIYISFFKVEDIKAAMKKIDDKAWEIKRDLANHIKNQVRRIPVLHFYLDDTLDYVFKMEDVFKKIETDKLNNNLAN
ncbi:MAG TPA: 30S ribosome-binding factor RbfA [Chitinophagaceae bacterium]|nr:30S ribosome-binding factor RbfA [Chitinophagaceae bacterium]MCC6634023.1 30S ribosome-binding factor RbfA [Chitinophagaceae bacterium]HMZ45610.1 30S ribosome-binding factor RbfA [Chitinophagaceae bacterium]HNE92523.1 30S ribosome-binding factor RbfA [Chitinophagaceae bacterium]HNF29980.1 30S ribosome-binding factor RbfA [Chitinophagaceae bacterium]